MIFLLLSFFDLTPHQQTVPLRQGDEERSDGGGDKTLPFQVSPFKYSISIFVPFFFRFRPFRSSLHLSSVTSHLSPLTFHL